MFEKIKKWYIQGLWTEVMVRNAVNKGIITEDKMYVYSPLFEKNTSGNIVFILPNF